MPYARIPSVFDAIDSVVIVRFATDGQVLSANAGLHRLCAGASSPAWQLFRQPRLDELVRTTPDAHGVVHQGLLVLREPQGDLCSLTGTVFASGDGLLVVAGYDIEALTRASALLLDLNNQLDAARHELVRANQELAQRAQASHLISLTDTLTGVGNRRHFDERLASEVERAWRYAQPLSLVLLDIDHFKRINDTWGHEAGDRVLRHIGATLREALRQTDSVSRFGGEEFVVLMPGLPHSEAVAAAERMRCMVESLPIEGLPQVTASFGVASLGPGERGERLFAHADAALYRAKARGRNCVLGFAPDDTPRLEHARV